MKKRYSALLIAVAFLLSFQCSSEQDQSGPNSKDVSPINASLPDSLAKMPVFKMQDDSGLWGFIDSTGSRIISAQFGNVKDFQEGLAAASMNSWHWGFIDKAGRWVIKPELELSENSRFQEGRILVKQTKLYGAIDTHGNWVVEPIYKIMRPFHEGLAAVLDVNTQRWGYVDSIGKVAIKTKYRDAGDFGEGLAFVQFDRREGYIDENGRYVEDFDPDVSGDQYIVWGIIDKSGRFVNDKIFGSGGRFSEGMAGTSDIKKHYRYSFGYINKSGEWVIKPQFGDGMEFNGGYAKIMDGHIKTYHLINASGNYVNRKYETFGSGPWFSEGLAVIWTDGGWKRRNRLGGFMNKKGQIKIKPIFQGLGPFSQGLASASKNGTEWGFIDKSANWVIEPQFSRAGRFRRGLAEVTIGKEDAKSGYVDKDGNLHPAHFRTWAAKKLARKNR